MNAVVNGLMASYQKVGSGGKVLVFLHGWADTNSPFQALAERLSSAYTLLLLDFPGFGQSQQPPEAWNTDKFSSFVADWLTKIGVSDVEAFVTHSFGGSIAINGLADGSLKARKLVLIASAGIRGKKSVRKFTLLAMAKIMKLGLLFVPKPTRQKLRAKIYEKIGSDMVTYAQMEPSFRLIIDEDMRANAQKVKIPTLLIYGEKDDQTPVEDGKIFHQQIAGSKLEVINGASHYVHQEAPDQVAKLIVDFLEAK